jgi:two-component system, response regulator YesN
LNLLLVDDEYYSVEGLRSSIEGMQLGFEHISCAYNMQQAQEIFQSSKVDIMISDIEMPKGTGLDLLKWVRDNGYNTVTIFLTSYANFNYASNAIKLQSIDYLLKPIDNNQLYDCMTIAVNKVRQLEVQESYQEKSKHWDNNKKRLEEQFWSDLCLQRIPPESEKIAKELKQYHLPQTLLSQSFYIALLHAYIKREEDKWEINLYEYAIKNVISEILGIVNIPSYLVRVSEKQFLIIINKEDIPGGSAYIKLCNQVVHGLKKSLPGLFQLYIGREAPLENSSRTFECLNKYAYNNIREDCKVIDITKPMTEKYYTNTTFFNEWSNMLMQHKKTEVKEQALHFLSQLQKSDMANRSDLIRFNHDFMQVIYSILEKSGESAHRLFDNSTSEQIFDQACNSIESMKTWLSHVIDVFDQCLLTINQSDSSIELIKNYVREHLEDDLNRKKLASLVYLSPDYISHVFSERTGESLTTFILNERIKKAKELLLLSQKSIRDIALLCGFPNISYFSRQFKSLTGKTPQEFRKNRNSVV